MIRIEFLYWEECPSHEQALALLHKAMQQQSIHEPIEMIRIENEEEARQQQFFGSPTIRVNGQDIAPILDSSAGPSLTCRAYRRSDGKISPLPPIELIKAALEQSLRVGERSE